MFLPLSIYKNEKKSKKVKMEAEINIINLDKS